MVCWGTTEIHLGVTTTRRLLAHLWAGSPDRKMEPQNGASKSIPSCLLSQLGHGQTLLKTRAGQCGPQAPSLSTCTLCLAFIEHLLYTWPGSCKETSSWASSPKMSHLPFTQEGGTAQGPSRGPKTAEPVWVAETVEPGEGCHSLGMEGGMGVSQVPPGAAGAVRTPSGLSSVLWVAVRGKSRSMAWKVAASRGHRATRGALPGSQWAWLAIPGLISFVSILIRVDT